MRSKYKMRDKNTQSIKQFNLSEQNINYNPSYTIQRSKSPMNNIIKRFSHLYNKRKKNNTIQIDEICNKVENQKKNESNNLYKLNFVNRKSVYNNKDMEKRNENTEKKEIMYKTNSYSKNVLKPNKIITKTLSIVDSNLENKNIIKKQNNYEQTKTQVKNINKSLMSERLSNYLAKKVLTEANEKEIPNNNSKNDVNKRLLINTNTNNNYIKKLPLYMSKRTLYKNLNKPNTVRNYFVAYNTNNSKDNSFSKDKGKHDLTFNNQINNTINRDKNIKDIKTIKINARFKKEKSEIESKYIKIKPDKKISEKKTNEIEVNKKDNINEKDNINNSSSNNNIIKIRKMDYFKEHPNSKFYNIKFNKRKKEDNNEFKSKNKTLIEENMRDDNIKLISEQPKSFTSRLNMGLYSKKKLKTDINNEFNYTQTEPIISRNEIKKPFHYLVQQIYKNKNFNDSFYKFTEYQKNKQKENILINNSKSFKKNENNSLNINEINLHLDLSKSSLYRRRASYGRNLSHKKFDYKNNNNLSYNKTLSERKFSFNSREDTHNYISDRKAIDNSNSYINNSINEDKNISVISNNIINNNTFNTTFNFYNINNNGNKENNNNNVDNNSPIKNFGISPINMPTFNNNPFLIDINTLYMLENKLKSILDKIINYQECGNECYNYILYYFNNHLYNELLKFFKNNHNKSNALNQIKIELINIFLCYDISVGNSFNQAAILLKTIFEIIYSNFLVIISFFLNENTSFCQNEIYCKLKQIINLNLKIKLNKEDMNEFNILKIINNNSKNLLNYYKIIIDNLYSRYYVINQDNMKFPQCLKNIDLTNISKYRLLNIISIFFFDSYRLINNYNFTDLYNFFNMFLNKDRKTLYDNKNNINSNFTIIKKFNNINTFKNNNNSNFFLPPINKKYKYSLVLDLDETLIYLQNKININNDKYLNNPFSSSVLILRPGLIDFLRKMKQIYELIIFSFGTLDYIMPIIKIIEKKEKFFEHILYRKHVSFLKNGEYYKDLNLLNRNIKTTIIVDNIYKNFVLHKSNGICIKPFNGDVINDRNTLELLGTILQKIRYDADVTGDIRISLQDQKNLIYSEIAVNIEKDEVDYFLVE